MRDCVKPGTGISTKGSTIDHESKRRGHEAAEKTSSCSDLTLPASGTAACYRADATTRSITISDENARCLTAGGQFAIRRGGIVLSPGGCGRGRRRLGAHHL